MEHQEATDAGFWMEVPPDMAAAWLQNNSPSWQTPSGRNELRHSCMNIKVLKADLQIRRHISLYFL